MTLRAPPASTNRAAAATFGPIEPEANWPSRGVRADLGQAHPGEVALVVGAPVDGGVVDVGGDDEDVGVEGSGEQRGGEVLVDDGLDPAQATGGVAHDGDAATPGRDDDVAGGEQGAQGRGVEHLERLGGGDDPAPALLAAVLPHLAVVDHRLCLRVGEVATDRLARVRETGVVTVDEGARHEGGDRPGRPSGREGVVEGVEDREAEGALRLGAAPVERHRWDDVRGELVLHEEVADLGAVAVGDDELVTGRDEARCGLHRDLDGGDLGRRGGAAVGRRHRVSAQGEHDTHVRPSSAGSARPRWVPGVSTLGAGARAGVVRTCPTGMSRVGNSASLEGCAP